VPRVRHRIGTNGCDEIAIGHALRSYSSLGCASEQDSRKEPDVPGKKRPKSLVQTEKKTAAKPKRPKKTSRGK
jgi:hypothetical protein